MATMSEETICEVVKSCAYGYTVDELTEHYGICNEPRIHRQQKRLLRLLANMALLMNEQEN